MLGFLLIIIGLLLLVLAALWLEFRNRERRLQAAALVKVRRLEGELAATEYHRHQAHENLHAALLRTDALEERLRRAEGMAVTAGERDENVA